MRSKEQGSVIGFVLGGILLLALLVGGIMLYKNNINKLTGVSSDNKVANDDAIKQTEADSKQAAQNEAALKQQQEAEKKAQEQNAAANSGTGATSTQNSTGSTPQTAAQVPHTSGAPAQALPTTGPAEDALMAAAGAGLVFGASMAYYRSRAAL